MSLPAFADENPKRVSYCKVHREGDLVYLSDLDTAAYLFMRGIHLESAVKITQWRYRFSFYDEENLAEAYTNEFVNSQCADYADAVSRLKKVIHRFSGRNEFGSNGEAPVK